MIILPIVQISRSGMKNRGGRVKTLGGPLSGIDETFRKSCYVSPGLTRSRFQDKINLDKMH